MSTVVGIREAKGYITDGRYEEAITEARLALDYVRQVVPPDQSAPGAKAKGNTQGRRWRVLIGDFYSPPSGASHDDPVGILYLEPG